MSAHTRQWLIELAHGRDDRAVEPNRPAKSAGSEETYATDLSSMDEIRREIDQLARGVAEWLGKQGQDRAHGDDQGAVFGFHHHHAQPERCGTDRRRRQHRRAGRSSCSTRPKPARGRSACSASACTISATTDDSRRSRGTFAAILLAAMSFDKSSLHQSRFVDQSSVSLVVLVIVRLSPERQRQARPGRRTQARATHARAGRSRSVHRARLPLYRFRGTTTASPGRQSPPCSSRGGNKHRRRRHIARWHGEWSPGVSAPIVAMGVPKGKEQMAQGPSPPATVSSRGSRSKAVGFAFDKAHRRLLRQGDRRRRSTPGP